MSNKISSSLLTIPLLASSLLGIGCGCSRAAYAPHAAVEQSVARAAPVAPGDACHVPSSSRWLPPLGLSSPAQYTCNGTWALPRSRRANIQPKIRKINTLGKM